MKGNPVMKAKRITGPMPNTELCLRVQLAQCSVKGCTEPPARTVATPGDTIVRRCIGHIGPQQANKRIPLMCAIGFDRQIGQQSAGFVVGKAADSLPIETDLHRPQE